jgi:hypothetical protein
MINIQNSRHTGKLAPASPALSLRALLGFGVQIFPPSPAENSNPHKFALSSVDLRTILINGQIIRN